MDMSIHMLRDDEALFAPSDGLKALPPDKIAEILMPPSHRDGGVSLSARLILTGVVASLQAEHGEYWTLRDIVKTLALPPSALKSRLEGIQHHAAKMVEIDSSGALTSRGYDFMMGAFGGLHCAPSFT